MIFTGTGNANKILGIPVQTGTPSDTFTLLYDAASSRWIFGPSGTPPAGGVGGGAALTTVGSVPFVTSSGVLGQNTNFRFFTGTGNLVVGTTTDDGTNRLQVAGNMRMASNTPKLIMRDTASGTADFEFQALGNQININRGGVATLGAIDFLNGLFTWYNQTPTTGSTSLVVRAGAGQGGNNLTTWQNSGGTEVARVNAGGGMAAQEFFNLTNTFYQNGVNVDVGSGGIYRFASSASQGATKDLSLSRASANTLQVGDGGSNSNGIILSRRVQSAGETVASLPAAAAGNAGTISYVTDSNSTIIGATVAGGGANKVLVWSNGTAWRIFAN